MNDISRRLLMQVLAAAPLLGSTALAQGTQPGRRESWVATWTASAHGPYPSGNPSAQPEQGFAFPDPAAGARDQTFRLMIRPDLWGRTIRLRFTNAFGTQPLAIDNVQVGLQGAGGSVARGTSRPVSFVRAPSATIAPGATLWSDPVALPFVRDPGDPLLQGRRLAVSFHVPGPTGPMTWHAKALTTNYVTAPGAGVKSAEESDTAFPYTTAAWFFLDMVDVMAPGVPVVAGFGDSITDGTASTMNGDDRWPDVLSRRLHQRFGGRVSVVNAGIGGNRIVGPAEYTPQQPVPGGPSALSRLDRDLLQISGLRTVIWLEGINDIATGSVTAEQIIAGLRDGIARIRARGARVIGAMLTSALGAQTGHGTPAADAIRQAVNAWIRAPGNFDAVADFDAATRDPATGALRAEFQPNSTIGGPGDKLHPNRAGYLAMAGTIDLDQLGLAERRRR